MISEIVWVQTPDNSSKTGDFFAHLFAPDDVIVVSDQEPLENSVAPSLFQDQFTCIIPADLVNAKALAVWVKVCADADSDVTLVVPYAKAPLKVAKSHNLTVVDATVTTADSVHTLVAKAGKTIDAGAVKKILTAKDKAPQILCELLVACDHIDAPAVTERLPVPEEKFYLISSAVLSGDNAKVEKLLSSFDEYKVPMQQVLAFLNKQVMASVACINVPRKDQRVVALHNGVSEKSVTFFLRGLPNWSTDQGNMALWILRWMDTMAKSHPADIGDQAVRAGVRNLSRLS